MNKINSYKNGFENKFDGRAEDYSESRPNYSPELIKYFCEKYGINSKSVIADIGSGTGKFSEQLLKKHCTLYCVEPNEDMRHKAEKELGTYPEFHSVAGSGEYTKLKNNSVDYITAAQSFHWFRVKEFKRECARIIKPGGLVFLIWNMRECGDDFNKEWQNIFFSYCPDFTGFSGRDDRDRINIFFGKENQTDKDDIPYEYRSFNYPLMFNKENFIKRSLSSSYSLKKGDGKYAEYVDKLGKLFDRYATEGKVLIKNQSVAYIGKIK